MSLLGYSFLPGSSFDAFRLDQTIEQIGTLLAKSANVESFNEDNHAFTRESLDDFELGRLLGSGCNAAVYEARLRTSRLITPTPSISSVDHDSESDFEILSRQSSDSSSSYEDAYDHLDEEQRLNELTLREGEHVHDRSPLRHSRCCPAEVSSRTQIAEQNLIPEGRDRHL